MKKACVFLTVLLVLLCATSIGNVVASGGVLIRAEDTGRYQIVLLRSDASGPMGPNEVILLDKETGRTWTLRTGNLIKGWVLMPRVDKPSE